MSKLVLVAEDSPVVRVAIVRRLRWEGYEVAEAESVASACSIDPCSLACALLDLDLGDGWGTEVAARLRERSATLPVAFFTSEAYSSVLETARGFGRVFAKPAELESAIAWILSAT